MEEQNKKKKPLTEEYYDIGYVTIAGEEVIVQYRDKETGKCILIDPIPEERFRLREIGEIVERKIKQKNKLNEKTKD